MTQPTDEELLAIAREHGLIRKDKDPHQGSMKAFSDFARAVLAKWGAPQQPAPQQAAPAVGNSGFDHKTAADFLSGKTVSDEAMRKFVAASRWAHDDRAGLQVMLQSVRDELASREAEIALLKAALMNAEAAPQQAAPDQSAINDAIGKLHMLMMPVPAEEVTALEVCKVVSERALEIINLLQQAAPQQAAPAEPVMIYRGRCTIDCGENGHHDVELLRMIPKGTKLYTAPQPPDPGLVPLAAVLARVDACAGPGSAVRLALEREFGQPAA